MTDPTDNRGALNNPLSPSDPDLDELAEISRQAGGLGTLTDEEDDDSEILEAYCVRCRNMVEIEQPEAVWTSKGTPGMRGICPDCGTTVFRMGKTAAHNALARPAAVRVESGPKIATTGRRRAQSATYINFAHADSDFAHRLADDLRNVGVNPWIESADKPEGGPEIKWAGGVHPALRDSAGMIAILSPQASADHAFGEAWQYFRKQKKPVIVLVLGNVEVPDGLRRNPRFVFEAEDRVYHRAFRQLLSALAE